MNNQPILISFFANIKHNAWLKLVINANPCLDSVITWGKYCENMNVSVNEELSFITTTTTPWLSENISNKSFNGSEQDIMDLRGNQSKSYAQCNESVYFICPDPDPLLQACASITLQSELKVYRNMKIVSINFIL